MVKKRQFDIEVEAERAKRLEERRLERMAQRREKVCLIVFLSNK